MNKLIKACIAMAAFAAFLVVPSIASAIQLTLPTGTKAANGTKLMATNIAIPPENKVHTLFTTPIGTVTCPTATLTGELLTNSPATNPNHILGEITTVEFTGHGTPNCTSPVGNARVTPNHTVNPTHTPTGGSPHHSLPWCITAEKENRLLVWGKTTGESCHNPVNTNGPTFTLHTDAAGTCSYEKEAGGPLTATYATHPTDAIATVDAGQPYKKITGGLFCPNSGTLDMKFTMTGDNNGVSGEPAYIDLN